MRIGMHVVSYDFPDSPVSTRATLAEVGHRAEEIGLDNLSCMDHYFQLGFIGPVEGHMLEGYTTLGFLAAHTEALDLQLLVTGVTYRHPALLAKIVSTLDVLSGGRAVLGLGAAWYEREHVGLGVAFPSVAERFERLEETLKILRQMWSPDNGPFDGRHYQLAETLCSPQPIRSPSVMVGGSGERKTLRLVAEYADACNLFVGDGGVEALAAKFEVLRTHCNAVGRSYDDVRKTVLWQGDLLPLEQGPMFLRNLAELADLGVDEVHVMHLGNEPVQFLAELEPLVEQIHAL